MSVDPRWLSGLAAQTGFRAATLEKVIRLGEVAGDITRHPLLSRALVLKGGTAINLCFGEPRRLSVDLDFNYIGNLHRDAMVAERPAVERAIETIAQGRGYAIQESAEEHGGRKLYLRYRSASGTPDRIEVDVNYLYRAPLGEPRTLALWQPPTVERPIVLVVGSEELAGGKLVAFFDRAAPRDAYDVAHLADIVNLTSSRTRQVFLAMSIVLPHPIHSYRRQRLSRLLSPRIDTDLAPMLARSERVDAGELTERAWSEAERFLELSQDERQFVDLANEGELRPALIASGDEAFASLLARHPAILWKLENARRRRG